MPGSQHFLFTSSICMALCGTGRAIKKSLFLVEKSTPLRRGESPAACRGGGGPLIRNAQQYLNFTTFGSHFPTLTQGKCQVWATIASAVSLGCRRGRISKILRQHSSQEKLEMSPGQNLWGANLNHHPLLPVTDSKGLVVKICLGRQKVRQERVVVTLSGTS